MNVGETVREKRTGRIGTIAELHSVCVIVEYPDEFTTYSPAEFSDRFTSVDKALDEASDRDLGFGRDPLSALVNDIARTCWQNLCWFVRTTRRSLRDNR